MSLGEPELVHQPVLLQTVLSGLSYRPDAVVVDATVGQAGHAAALAERLNEDGCLIGLDVDPDSLAAAAGRLSKAACRTELICENFGMLDEVLARLNIEAVDVILADLGVSSAQLADPDRGISFQQEGPLDMRLDSRLTLTAGDIVNSWSEKDLADTIWQFGEERHSRRIARAIMRDRQHRRIETTTELVEIIKAALGIGEGWRRSKIHPATRTFQALRIVVNQELDQLQRLLSLAPRLLGSGGQVAVISFHSLEDRLVKNSFREGKTNEVYEILTKKPLIADDMEKMDNPRSRSAKLRIARRIQGLGQEFLKKT